MYVKAAAPWQAGEARETPTRSEASGYRSNARTRYEELNCFFGRTEGQNAGDRNFRRKVLSDVPGNLGTLDFLRGFIARPDFYFVLGAPS
jgi:hypothetical protein